MFHPGGTTIMGQEFHAVQADGDNLVEILHCVLANLWVVTNTWTRCSYVLKSNPLSPHISLVPLIVFYEAGKTGVEEL